MLNKLSYNLASSLNESESEVLKVSKKVLIESDGVKTEAEEGSLVETSYEYMSNKSGIPVEDLSKVVPKLIKKDKNFRDYATDYQIRIIKKELEKLKSKESIKEAEELKEGYSETFGGDPADFVSDVESIKAALEAIDVSGFGTHLAQQMIEEWLDICSRQIEKGKRLASGDEFYSESSLNENEDINSNVLTKEQLWKLRKEIVLGSIYTNDYENSFGINPENVQAFFDSFIENAQQDDEGNFNNRKVEEFDNPDELYDYYAGCEFPFGEMNESEDCSKQKIEEAEEVEVKNLQVIKEQGNIYMLEDENKKMIVGENYNADEGIIENAEIYENKEEADKDYLSRCDIIKDGEEFKSEEPIEEAEEINPDEPQYGEDMLENMWTAVCSNDLNYVKNAYNKNLVQPNTRYTTGSGSHSLIMGALRNKNYEMVDLLKSFGEKITKSELEEYKNEMAKRTYEDDVTKEVMDEGIIDDLKLNHRVKKADKASERYDADKSKRNKKRMNKAFNKLDAEKDRQIKKHQDKINKIKKA